MSGFEQEQWEVWDFLWGFESPGASNPAESILKGLWGSTWTVEISKSPCTHIAYTVALEVPIYIEREIVYRDDCNSGQSLSILCGYVDPFVN